MTEKKQQLKAIYKLLWCVVFAVLYAWGGMEYKWLRRFIAPIWLGGGLWLFGKNWKTLIQSPLLIVSLHLGYGADVLVQKIIRRGIFGLAVGATPFWLNKKVYIFNIALCVSAYIVFGVWNILPNARTEELFLGFIVGFLSIMSVKND